MLIKSFFHKKVVKKFISLMALSFLISGQAQAGVGALPENLKFNAKYGRVCDSETTSSEKMIIHIQDAHCIYEAQQNIMNIIRDLYKNHNVSLVTLEGADGFLNADKLSSFPVKRSREDVADYFLKKGRLSGSECLMVEGELPLSFRGVENRDLYVENYNSFIQALPDRDDPVMTRVNDIIIALESLKTYMLNEELQELDVYDRKYASQQILFSDYADILKNYAEQYAVKIDRFKNLESFYEMKEIETQIDFTEVHKELSSAINALSEIVSKEELAQLLYKHLNYKLQQITPQEFFEYFTETARGYDLSSYSNVATYITYLNQYEKIDQIALFDELEKVMQEIQNQLYDNTEQRQLIQLAKESHILKNLVSLKVTKNELKYYENNTDLFTVDRFLSFLKQHAPTYQIPFNTLSDYSVISQRLPLLDDFYTIAKKRNEALIGNTLAEMDLEDTNIAVLVTGGFHTEGITEILKREGISYKVISPVLTQHATNELYLSRIAGLPTEIEQMLTAERLSVPLVLGETTLLGDGNVEQFMQVFRTLLDIDTAINTAPENLPDTYKATVNYLDAFAIQDFPVTVEDGTVATAPVKFLAFQVLGQTYHMAVLPEGMQIEGARGASQTVGGRELVLMESVAFVNAQQNPGRENIAVAANTINYYIDAAMTAGRPATVNVDASVDLALQLDELIANNMVAVGDGNTVQPTFAYLLRTGLSQLHIQPKVALVKGLHVDRATRAYLEQQGITQIVAFSNHSELTPAEAAELNNNLTSLLQNRHLQLSTGKNVNAVVQDGVAQIFSTQDTAVKPFIPIPHSIFEAMVPEYESLKLLSPTEADTQGYIELGVVDGQVTVTLYQIDEKGAPTPAESYRAASPNASEGDIFDLILKARQQAYVSNIGLLGYGNPAEGISISFANLDELMEVVDGNPVRQAAVNVLSALSVFPAYADVTYQSLIDAGVTSIADVADYVQAQTPQVELPDVTCAAYAAAVVHENIEIADMAYTRESSDDYAQFLLQLMLFIDARQRPDGIEQIDGKVFNSMYSISVAYQLAGRNTQAVSVVPVGQELSAEQRNARLVTVLEQLPVGESAVIALKTSDGRGHFINVRHNNYGYEIYDVLTNEKQAGVNLPALIDSSIAVSGIQYLVDTYLNDNYGSDAFTGEILVGQAVPETGNSLKQMLESGTVRYLSRREQFAVTGALSETESCLAPLVDLVDPDTLVVLRNCLDRILVSPKKIEEQFGAFASENYFEKIMQSARRTITDNDRNLFNQISQLYSHASSQGLSEFIRELVVIFDQAIPTTTFTGLYGAIGVRKDIGNTNPLETADTKILQIIQNHLAGVTTPPSVNSFKSLYYWAQAFRRQDALALIPQAVPALEYLVLSGITQQLSRNITQIDPMELSQYIQQYVSLELTTRDETINALDRDDRRAKYAPHPLAIVSQDTLHTIDEHFEKLRRDQLFPAELSDLGYWENIFNDNGETRLFEREGKLVISYLIQEAKNIYQVYRPKGEKPQYNGEYVLEAIASTIKPFLVTPEMIAAAYARMTEVAQEEKAPGSSDVKAASKPQDVSVSVQPADVNDDAAVVATSVQEDPLAIKKEAAEKEGAAAMDSIVVMVRDMRQTIVAIISSQQAHASAVNGQFNRIVQQLSQMEIHVRRLSSDELRLVMNATDLKNLEGLRLSLNKIREIVEPLQKKVTGGSPANVGTAKQDLKKAWEQGGLQRIFNQIVNMTGDSSYALDLQKSFNEKVTERVRDKAKRMLEPAATIRKTLEGPPPANALQVMLDALQEGILTAEQILTKGLTIDFWQTRVFTPAREAGYGVNLPQLLSDQQKIITQALQAAATKGDNDPKKTYNFLQRLLETNIQRLNTPVLSTVSNRYSQDFLNTINEISQALGLHGGELSQLMAEGSFALVQRDDIWQIEGTARNALALISRIQNVPVELNVAKGTYHELVESITGQRPELVSHIVSLLEAADMDTPQGSTRIMLQTSFAQRYNMVDQPLYALVREAIAKIFTNDILPADFISPFYFDEQVSAAVDVLKSAVQDVDAEVFAILQNASGQATPQESLHVLTSSMEDIGLTLPEGVEQAIVDGKVEQWFDTAFTTELMAAITLFNDLPLPQAIENASRSAMVQRSIRRAQERAQLQNVVPNLTTMDFEFLVNDTVQQIVNNIDSYYDAEGKPTRNLLDFITAQGGISDSRTLGLAQLIQEYVANEENIFVIYSLEQDGDTIRKILDLHGISPEQVVIIDAETLKAENPTTPIFGLPAVIQSQLELEDGLTLEMSDLVLIATDDEVAQLTANQGAKVYLSPSGILPQNFSIGEKLAIGFNVFQAATRMAQGEPQFANLIVSHVAQDNIFIKELVDRIKQRTSSDVVTLEELVNELGGLKKLGQLNRSDVEGIVLSFPERTITRDDLQGEFMQRWQAQRSLETSA